MTARKSAPVRIPPTKTSGTEAQAGDARPPAAKPLLKGGLKNGARARPEPAARKGRKARDDEGAVPGGDDEDFGDADGELDVEADLEPEAEPAEAPDATEADSKGGRAKPLRMKVSRAKERALMREFGIDETALTEEEVAKRRQELKTLIRWARRAAS